MPRRSTPVLAPVLGRGQAGRPGAAPVSREGERSLSGALSVPIEQVVPDPHQPRRAMDADRLAELAASLQEYGVLQPLLVREDGALDDGRTRYMIIAGGRRYAAAQQAGLARLPVFVRDSEAEQLRVLQLTENIQREALDPVEEARALVELMDLTGRSQRDIAATLHITHATVSNRLALIKHEDVAAAVQPYDDRPALAPTVALEIAREKDSTKRRDLIDRARKEKLGVKDVQQLRRSPRLAPPIGGAPTLREVAATMGATEQQAHAAAAALKEEPTLTAAEAVALAQHAPAPPQTYEQTPLGEAHQAALQAVQAGRRHVEQMAALADESAQARWRELATHLLPLETQLEAAYNEAAQAWGGK